jgi:hypothetical protein
MVVPEATNTHEKLEEVEVKEPVISFPELTVAEVIVLIPLTLKVKVFKFKTVALFMANEAML